MYVVDKEAEIPQYSWFYASDRQSIHDNRWKTYEGEPNLLKREFPFYWLIIASNDPSLNLSLLPNIEENVEQLGERYSLGGYWHSDTGMAKDAAKSGFIAGYKAASAKKYTEEDMRKAWKSTGLLDKGKGQIESISFEEFLQSLNPLPITVEVEMEGKNLIGVGNPAEYHYEEWVPKVVNNIIQVKRWIYE